MPLVFRTQRRLFEHAASRKSHDADLLKARIARFLAQSQRRLGCALSSYAAGVPIAAGFSNPCFGAYCRRSSPPRPCCVLRQRGRQRGRGEMWSHLASKAICAPGPTTSTCKLINRRCDGRLGRLPG